MWPFRTISELSTRGRSSGRRDLDRNWDEEVEFRRRSWSTDFVEHHPSPAALADMAATPLAINWDVNRDLGRATLYPEAELPDACARCTVPSLFIHGSEDPRPNQGARLLSEQIPAAQFEVIESAGHLPWVERPEETMQTIATFLDGIPA